MNDQIKETFKLLSEQKKQTINKETFENFLTLFYDWLQILSSKTETKFTFFSSPKKFFIECIYLIRDCCIKSPESSSQYFGLIISIFILLLNPFNDIEIIQESLKSILHIIKVFIDYSQVPQWDELFVQVFSFSPNLASMRLNIGNKAINTRDILIIEIKIIIHFIHEIHDNYDYFFIWRILCRKCTTLIRLLFNKQTELCEEIAQIFILEAVSYLKKQQICSFLGQIPNIPRTSNLMIYDKLIPREICWMLSILQDSSNLSQNITYKDELCYTFIVESFPIQNFLQIDKDQYPISDLSYYLLACYSAAPQRRTNEAVACLCYDTNNCDSFSQLISVIFRLFFLFIKNTKIHIKIANLLRTIVYLHSQHKPGLFFPSKYIILMTLQPQNMFPSLFSIFLSILYDIHDIQLDSLKESVEILKKYTIQKHLFQKYLTILINLISQMAIAMMHSVFDIKTTIPEIQLCEKNPVIFSNIFIQNELLKSISTFSQDDLFMFNNLPTIKLSHQESITFLLNFLELFDETVHYLLTPVLAETLVLLLMIIPPHNKPNNGFLFHTILPRLLNLFFDKSNEIDSNVYIQSISKIISSPLYRTASVDFKTIILWNKASKIILSKRQEPSFSIVYFTATNLILNHTKYSIFLAPLLVETSSFAYSNATNEQKSLLFSALSSIFSIVRKNKSLEKYGLTYQNVLQNCLALINSFDHKSETVSNGIDQFVTLLFIDEVLRLKDDEKFDEVLWETVYSYILSCIEISDLQHFLFLSLPISILKKCLMKIPNFFTAMTTFCSSFIDSASYEMTSRILIFITNTLIILPRNSPEASILFQFFVPRNKNKEVEQKREVECNLFFHSYMKQSNIKHFTNPEFSSVIIQMESELQLLCLEHEKEQTVDLSISTNFGSSKYHLETTFSNEKENQQEGKAEKTSEQSIKEKINADQSTNEIKIDYSSCLVHFMKINPFPMFIDALSEINDNKQFKYLDETIVPEPLTRSMRALASRFAQRTHKLIAAVSVLYSKSNSEELNDLISPKWDETSSQFQNFINSLGKFKNPEEENIIKDVQSKMKQNICVISETLRITTIFNVAPLFNHEKDFDHNLFRNNPITIIWEEKLDITNKLLISKWNPNSVIFVISQLENGYFRVNLIKPTRKNYSTILFNISILPAEILPTLISLDISLIFEQMQHAKQNSPSNSSLFKSNWEEFFP